MSDIPSHWTEYRQMAFFPKTIPKWNSLPQEVTRAPSPRWLLCDQGLLFPESLTSINEKWVSEGWSGAGRGPSPVTAMVAGMVYPNTPK